MIWIVAVVLILVGAIVGVIATALVRTSRRCPSCSAEVVTVSAPGDGPNETYEVVACPHCSQTGTFVDGIRTTVAHCPSCHEPTLEVPTVRLAGIPPRVGVRETCTSCHHERSYTVSGPGEHLPGGTVIPFTPRSTGARRRDPPRPDRQSGGG